MNSVDLRYLEDYNVKELESVFRDSFNKLNVKEILKPNMKVLLKVCLPKKAIPESAEITNPNMVLALVNILADYGVKCVVADSPYGKYSKTYLDDVYFESGLLQVANDTGCELYTSLKTIEVECAEGIKTKSFKLIDVVKDVDAIINVGKLKIDESLGYLGACSNLFGLVPGEMKSIMLNRLTTQKDYHNLMLDLLDCLKEKVVLNILDGIVALQAGRVPHMLSMLAIGKSALNVDSVALKIIKQDYKNTIIKVAKDRKIINNTEIYKLINGKMETFNSDDFMVYEFDQDSLVNENKLKNRVYFNKNQQRPIIIPDKCKGCSVCSRICPANAIVMKYDKNGELFADIDYKKCIFCKKCYTDCPYKIVDLKTPSGYKKLNKIMTKYNEEDN